MSQVPIDQVDLLGNWRPRSSSRPPTGTTVDQVDFLADWRPQPNPTIAARLGNVWDRVAQFPFRAAAAIPTSAGVGLSAVGRVALYDVPPEIRGLVIGNLREPMDAMAQDIHQFADRTFPGNPDLQGDFWWDTMPQAVGSLGTFVAIGAVSPVALAGVAGSVGIAEMESRLQPMVDRGDLTQEEAALWSVLGAGPELVQMVPVMRFVNTAFGRTARRQFKNTMLDYASHGTLGATSEFLAESAGVIGHNAIERAAGNKGREWLDGVVEEGAAGGVAGFVAGIATRAVRGRLKYQGMTTREMGHELMKDEALELRVIDQEEAQLIGGDTEVLQKLILERLSNRQAGLQVGEDGTLSINSKPDSVSWQDKVALGHSEPLISTLRDLAERGEPVDFFRDPPTGPVEVSEMEQVLSDLEALRKQIKIRPDELRDGVPRTERALLVVDLNTTSQRLQAKWEGAEGRIELERTKALISTARRKHLASSKKAVGIQDGVESLQGQRIITPIDMAPVPRLGLVPRIAQAAGYITRPEDLSKNQNTQKLIAQAQRKFLLQYSAIRKRLQLDPPAREALSKRVEQDYVEKINRILEKDDNTAKEAKTRVAEAVATSGLTSPQKAQVMEYLLGRIDGIIQTLEGESQRGAIERLLEDLSRIESSPQTSKPRWVQTKRFGPPGRFYGTHVDPRPNRHFTIRSLPGHGSHVVWIEGTEGHEGRAGGAPVADAVLEGRIPISLSGLELIKGHSAENSTITLDLLGLLSLREQGVEIAHFPESGSPNEIVSVDLRSTTVEALKADLIASLEPLGVGEPIIIPSTAFGLEVVNSVYQGMLNSKIQSPSKRAQEGLREILTLTRSARAFERMAQRQEKGRAKLVELANTLPDHLATPFLTEIQGAGTPTHFKDIALRIAQAQTDYILQQKRESFLNTVKRGVKVRGKERRGNPNRDAILKILEERFPLKVGQPGTAERLPLGRRLLSKRPLTEEEELLLAIAEDYGPDNTFSQMSQAHAYVDRRLGLLEKRGGMTREGRTLLRFLFARMRPAGVEIIPAITGATDLGAARGAMVISTGEIEMAVDLLPSEQSQQFHTLLHEYLHTSWFTFLHKNDVKAVLDEHAKLLAAKPLKRKDAKSRAHEIVMDSGVRHEVDYFAESAHEFFAEVGSRYWLQEQVDLPVMQRIWKSVLDLGRTLLQELSRAPKIRGMVSQEMVEVFDRAIAGYGGKPTYRTHLSQTYGDRWAAVIEGDFQVWKPSDPKPVVEVDPSTDYTSVNFTELKKRLQSLTGDEVQNLNNQIQRLVRDGEIDRGLYQDYLRYLTEQDRVESLRAIASHDLKSDFWKSFEPLTAITKVVVDPVNPEGWLYRVAKGDTTNYLYRVLFSAFEPGFSRIQQHRAQTRKYLEFKVKEHLGFDPTVLGTRALHKHLSKRLKSGVTRGEAMWTYALWLDQGRRAPLEAVGIVAQGVRADAETVIGELSEKERAFIEDTKRFFQNNPFMEKAFSNVLMLTGSEIERNPTWFTSRREATEPETGKLPETFDEMVSDLIQSTSALHARVDHSDVPFDVSGGYISAFLRVSDQLARFAEIGVELHRASKLLGDNTFQREFKNRFGNDRYRYMRNYLRNLMGHIGRNPDIFDQAMNYIARAWVVKAIAGNITSALRQPLGMLTMLSDDTLDSSALVQAMVEGAGVSKRVGRDMKSLSGAAYGRLSAIQYAKQITVLSDSKPIRGLEGLTYWQDQSFVLQRMMDDFTLRFGWRAAEIMADKRGLVGEARKDFILDRFERAMFRTQSSAAELYETALELKAKEQPLVRGAIALQRELNRNYNVILRRITTARYHPTEANIAGAFGAIMMAGIVNTLVDVLLSELRDRAFGEPWWEEGKRFRQQLRSLAGRWYLLEPAVNMGIGVADKGSRFMFTESLLSPLADNLQRVARTAFYAADAVAGGEEGEEIVRQGYNRGRTKRDVNLEKAFDGLMETTSSLLGLPFWAMWNQSKGVYQWKREHYRLMMHYETERERYRRAEETNTLRWLELERVRARISQLHSGQAQGLLTQEEVQREVVGLLKGLGYE